MDYSEMRSISRNSNSLKPFETTQTFQTFFVNQQIAKHFRDFYFGGNWTAVSLKDQLTGLSYTDAQQSIHGLNSIATLVYHLHYYVRVDTKVLEGEKLNASDKESFNTPSFATQEEWDKFVEVVWKEAEHFATLIEQLPEEKWMAIFEQEKYGNYFRNIIGIVEHGHYHLGQITIIRKMLGEKVKR